MRTARLKKIFVCVFLLWVRWLSVSAQPTDSLEQQLARARTPQERFQLAQSSGQLALQSDLNRALRLFEQQEQAALELHNDSMLGLAVFNIGSVYGRMGKTLEARKYLVKALHLTQHSLLHAKVLMNLSNTAVHEGNHQAARNYLKQAMAIQKAYGDTASTSYGVMMLNYGMSLMMLKDYRGAERAFIQAKFIFVQIKAPKSFIAMVDFARGSLYKEMHNHQQALQYFQIAIANSEAHHDIINFLMMKSDLSEQLIWTHKPKEAIIVLHEILQIGEKQNLDIIRARVYEGLMLAYTKMGISDSAYHYQIKKNQVLDRLKQKEQRELELQYNVKEKEIQISNKAKELIVERNWRIVLTVAFLSCTLLIGTLVYVNRKRNLSNRKLKDVAEDLHQAIDELQAVNNHLHLAHNQLKDTQLQMIHSEKMAALGKLVAAVAHEINTPIAVASGAAVMTEKHLQEGLHLLPNILPKLNAQETQLFKELCTSTSLNALMLTSREEREARKSITKQLRALQIDEADEIAILLVQMGVLNQLDQFVPLLQHPDRHELLTTALHFSSSIRNQNSIRYVVSRATKIIKSLKTFTKAPEFEEPELVLVTEGIELVLSLYQYQLRTFVKLVKDFDSNLPRLLAYPDKLNQVWTNLIHNAIQAMQDNCTLIIRAFYAQEGITVQITDNGNGIKPMDLPYVFEPFFTTKELGQGLGLGLHISKQIVEMHGGQIWAESVPGNTTFTVFLPLISPLRQVVPLVPKSQSFVMA